jgi:hypothetical protein
LKQAFVSYGTALSSYSAKLRSVLENKGLAYEEREPPEGDRSEAFRRIVPMGTIPVIVIDRLYFDAVVANDFLSVDFASAYQNPSSPNPPSLSVVYAAGNLKTFSPPPDVLNPIVFTGVSPVLEPQNGALMGAGLAAVLGLRRWRAKSGNGSNTSAPFVSS